jgi:mono/diheme cytochrome c family protein
MARGRFMARVVALAALLALVTAPAVRAADADVRERGAKAFAHRCGMCHREGQTGTVVLARRLGAEKSVIDKRTDLTPEYVRFVVRNGLLNMPRISRVEMPDPDLDAVIVYLTTPR